MKVVRGEEVFVVTENRVGALADLAGYLSEANINIRAISAYAVSSNAYFRLITSDTQRTKDVLVDKGYSVEVKDVVICELEDKVGMLEKMARILKEAGVDLTYIYGTTFTPGQSAIIVFSSSDNEKAQVLLSSG